MNGLRQRQERSSGYRDKCGSCAKLEDQTPVRISDRRTLPYAKERKKGKEPQSDEASILDAMTFPATDGGMKGFVRGG
jgi:hypothetical protein